MQDDHGRVIDQLRVSVTDRCGLQCVYCMPAGEPIHAPREEILRYEEIAAIVERLQNRFGLKRVRISGGEPLARPHLESLVGLLNPLGLEEISMTTNGQDLARSIGALAAAGLRRVNVSLDSLDPERFRRITGGDLSRTLEGIDALDRAGLRPVKINTVVMRGYNEEDVLPLTRWAIERGYEIRFLELMAIGCVQSHHTEMFVPTRELRRRIGESFRMKPAGEEVGSPDPVGGRENALQPTGGDPGAPARRWEIEGNGLRGVVGFISPETEPFCGACRRLRLTARGEFLGCLMRKDGPDVRAAIRAPGGIDEEMFDRAVRAAVLSKPIERIRASDGHMMSIGG